MKNLYIICAGAFGRELESWLEQSPDYRTEWIIKGFLHSGESQHSSEISDYPICGDWKDFDFSKDDIVIIGITDPVWKENIYNHLKGRVDFLSFVHPSAIIGKRVRVGEGTVICPNCILTTNIEIGKCVTINCNSLIGHDAKVGDFSSLMPNVDLGGWTSVGKSCFMGTKSTLIPHKTIGDNCKITAGSVVVRSLKSNKTVFGNPAEEL